MTNNGLRAPQKAAMNSIKPAIKKVRRDLTDAKFAFKHQSAGFKKTLAESRAKMDEFLQTRNKKHNKQAAAVEDDSQGMKDTTNNLSNSFNAIDALINQLKVDILRGGSPPQSYLGILLGKLQDVTEESKKMESSIITTKPVWKQQWETKLQEIVKKQQELKHMENVVEQVNEGLAELKTMLSRCLLVLQMKNESGNKTIFVPPEMDESHGGIATVMTEMLAVQVDSDKRIEAMERNMKLRKEELRIRNENPFAKELSKFQLKNKGLFSTIEAMREERDAQVLNGSYRAPTE